jgi:hypothetical protein
VGKVSSVSDSDARGIAALLGRKNVIKSEDIKPDMQEATLTRKPTEK